MVTQKIMSIDQLFSTDRARPPAIQTATENMRWKVWPGYTHGKYRISERHACALGREHAIAWHPTDGMGIGTEKKKEISPSEKRTRGWRPEWETETGPAGDASPTRGRVGPAAPDPLSNSIMRLARPTRFGRPGGRGWVREWTGQ
jgi:hypothetical protein